MDGMTSNLNDSLREQAVKEITAEQSIRKRKLAPLEFIQQVSKRFIEKQIDAFPMICDITRMQNKLAKEENEKYGKKGKYTDSYGWSDGYSFKHDFEIPSELYLFMVNLVYKDFWEEENSKVWRKFMHLILTGTNYTDMQTLMWAKMIYGSNSQKESVTTSPNG